MIWGAHPPIFGNTPYQLMANASTISTAPDFCCPLDHFFVAGNALLHSTSPLGKAGMPPNFVWQKPWHGSDAKHCCIAFQQIPLSLWLATTCSASNRLVCECTLIVWQGDEGGHKAKHFCIALVTALCSQKASYGSENAFKMLHFCAFRWSNSNF